MISEQTFYGGAALILLNGADKTLNPRQARVWRVETGSGIAGVRMPDATTYRIGGPHLVIVNATGVSLAIKNQSGTAIVTPNLPAGQACIVTLLDNSTANGTWGTEFRTWSAA
jgi:hypothetical protein